MKRICLIENNEDMQRFVSRELSSWYSIQVYGTLQAAYEALQSESFDVILLDVNMPDGNGFEVCASLKNNRKTRDTVVIFLTERAGALDKLMGFSLGADDYVTKPFETLELRARIDARLRKSMGSVEVADDKPRVVGPIRFDSMRQRAYMCLDLGERDLSLTPLQFKILHFLAMNEGRIFSRSELMKSVMEANVHVKDDNIYTHISVIRKKLGTFSHMIECMPRMGYRFCSPVRKAA